MTPRTLSLFFSHQTDQKCRNAIENGSLHSAQNRSLLPAPRLPPTRLPAPRLPPCKVIKACLAYAPMIL